MKLSSFFKNAAIAFIFISSTYLVACNNTETTEKNSDSVTVVPTVEIDSSTLKATNLHAEAILSGTNADTTVDGKATFDVMDRKVKMVLNLNIPKMANKSVAVHLHEHGACGDMGKDAHGHWNPTDQQHGKWGSLNFHLGDIGNVAIDANGKGTFEMETDLWTIGGDSTSNILGRAVIVHSGVDDYKSQPAGNAGSRIGCGVIQ